MRHIIPKEIKAKRKLINFLYVYDLIILFSVFLFNNYVLAAIINRTLSLVTFILLESFTIFMLTPSPNNRFKRRWHTYYFLFSNLFVQKVFCIMPQKKISKQETTNSEQNEEQNIYHINNKKINLLGRI